MPISVVILTFNSEKHLEKVLKALEYFDEVLLLDSGSTDRTEEIAKKSANVNFHYAPFDQGYGVQRNRLAALARNDWIFQVDSDELISNDLLNTLQKLALNPKNVYSMPFHNYFNARWIKTCGWYPDRHIRLYHKEHAQWTPSLVHERLVYDGAKEIQLSDPIIHYSYSNTSDFLTKMQRYSDYFAQQNQGKKSSSPFKALLRGTFAFFKSYVIKRGFTQGYEGFVISVYNANTAFYKYIKLYESNK